ncbi:MAG: exonuclease SbcC [Nitrosarchaeum sp.]|nr:MAG: exonuclease SbcC [Nitrosarchaeum sp.]
MVFGWGKKKEEKISEEIPLQKQIQLSDVSKIIHQILELRTTQILSDIKSIRNNTEPLIAELIMIGNTLEKDDLQVDDIDKHLRIIVVRGKQQVIDMIKKDAIHLPNIASYDDAENLSVILNQMLKKIGDVLGRQTRVIHIFAKKYAEKLKEILIQMNSNHVEIQQLLKNYEHAQSLSTEILESLKEIVDLENNITKKEQRIAEIHSFIDSLDKKILSFEDSIKKIQTSDEYGKFLDLKQILAEFTVKKNQIKNDIDSQFTKISRPLSRYEYVSSLDKEQKNLLSKLIEDPFEVLLSKNRDSIILILENVRKGITSGSISVKDTEKSFSQITETEEALDGFIKQVTEFVDKRKNIQDQMIAFESNELSDLTSDLKNALSDKEDSKSKIKTFQDEINESNSNIPKLISNIEVKLRTFSNTAYAITYPKFN